jgi:hypothetical protein
MACSIPLVDATYANGTLEVLPGVYEEPYPHQQTAEGKFYLPQEVLPDSPPRTLPCRRCPLFGSISPASYPAQSDDNDPLDPGDVAERSPAVTDEVCSTAR